MGEYIDRVLGTLRAFKEQDRPRPEDVNSFPTKSLVMFKEHTICYMDSQGVIANAKGHVEAQVGDIALVVRAVPRKKSWWCPTCDISQGTKRARSHFRALLIHGVIRAVPVCCLAAVPD